MLYEQALEIAERTKALLAPHCERIEIAGSIRRKKPHVKDIEIVAIPKSYNIGLFESGITTVINQWQTLASLDIEARVSSHNWLASCRGGVSPWRSRIDSSLGRRQTDRRQMGHGWPDQRTALGR